MLNADCRMSNNVRNKVVWGGRLKAGIALAVSIPALVVIASCGEAVSTGQSPAYLQLLSLEGAKGGGPNAGAFGASLPSDVLTLVPAKTGTPTVFADNGQATLQLVMKDNTLSPSPANAVTLTQYHVKYTRADGHNVQGVDVPYEFDGVLTLTISNSGTVAFTLVRVQAKQEAPLAALVNNPGVISTIAEVTFYGHDQNGRAVNVSGQLTIDFSDWGD
jgi:hypothetical protein